MKKIRLSGPVERVGAVCLSALAAGLFLFLLYAFRAEPFTLLIAIVCGLILLAVVGFYTVFVFSAACTPDKAHGRLLIHTVPACCVDVADAARIQTQQVQTPFVTAKYIAIYAADGSILKSLPTAFTARSGAKAEAAAAALADALGIAYAAAQAQDDAAVNYDAMDDL